MCSLNSKYVPLSTGQTSEPHLVNAVNIWITWGCFSTYLKKFPSLSNARGLITFHNPTSLLLTTSTADARNSSSRFKKIATDACPLIPQLANTRTFFRRDCPFLASWNQHQCKSMFCERCCLIIRLYKPPRKLMQRCSSRTDDKTRMFRIVSCATH